MIPRPGVLLPTEGGHHVQVAIWQGEGSYAHVFRAQYGRTSGPCALKVCKAEIPGAAPRLLAQREALAGIRHPHVVALLDWGHYDSTPFLVLEWLEGDTLLDRLTARRRLPLVQALEIMESVFDGLAGLHAAGRYHGDVRCSNLILVPGRGAVLADPGSPAGIEADSAAQDTGASAACDIMAAGRILHRALTGEDPGTNPRLASGAGFNRKAVELWRQTQHAEPPAAAQLLAEVRALRASL